MQNHSCLQIGGVSGERVKPEQVLRHCRVWLYALQLVMVTERPGQNCAYESPGIRKEETDGCL